MTERSPEMPSLSLRQERKSRRDLIVKHAAASFYERGFDRTTVRDIADRVGITSGSIFYHFESKEELLAWVIREGLKLGHETAERALLGQNTAIGQYQALIRGHLEALHRHGYAHKVSVREWDRLTDAARRELKQINNRYRERWLLILGALRDEGILRSDPETTRRMLIASLNWTLHYRDVDLTDLGDLALMIGASGLNMSVPQLSVSLKSTGRR